MVIQKSGGPYLLYCTECHTWFPNTANSEMIKEGVFAHSHVCGVRYPGCPDITDEEWEAQKKEKAAKKEKTINKEVVTNKVNKVKVKTKSRILKWTHTDENLYTSINFSKEFVRIHIEFKISKDYHWADPKRKYVLDGNIIDNRPLRYPYAYETEEMCKDAAEKIIKQYIEELNEFVMKYRK